MHNTNLVGTYITVVLYYDTCKYQVGIPTHNLGRCPIKE